MTIKSCPHCAEYSHFDSGPRIARCWQCGATVNFAQQRTPEERLWGALASTIHILLTPVSSCMRLQKIAPLALIVAVPIIIAMQLLFDSRDSTSINLWPVVF